MIARLISIALFCAGLFCVSQAQVSMTGAGKGAPGGGGGAYSGPGDVVGSSIAWYGLRAFNNTKANAGASTIKVADLAGSSIGACTLFLKGDGTGDVDLTTAGAGGLGNQCLLGATTFCTVTNTSCTVSTIYDQSGANACSATACDVIDNTLAEEWTLTFSCIGSLPCLSGSASPGSSYGALSTFGTIGSAFTHSIVARRNGSTTSFNTVAACAGSGTIQTGFSNSASTGLLFAGSVVTISSPAVNDSTLHALQAVYNGASSLMNVDGTQSATGNPGAANCDSIAPVIGIGGNNLNGFMAEVGFWGSALTLTQQNNMCHNQRLYWGSAGSC